MTSMNNQLIQIEANFARGMSEISKNYSSSRWLIIPGLAFFGVVFLVTVGNLGRLEAILVAANAFVVGLFLGNFHILREHARDFKNISDRLFLISSDTDNN